MAYELLEPESIIIAGSRQSGYHILAGSGITGDSVSGLIWFQTPFANANWFMTLSAQNYTNPLKSTTGSVKSFSVSGARRASGCWAYGPSGTAFDWIAVGL